MPVQKRIGICWRINNKEDSRYHKEYRSRVTICDFINSELLNSNYRPSKDGRFSF
nr:MAG TPA: TOPRIM domain protein [Bacteriophage sp.]